MSRSKDWMEKKEEKKKRAKADLGSCCNLSTFADPCFCAKAVFDTGNSCEAALGANSTAQNGFTGQLARQFLSPLACFAQRPSRAHLFRFFFQSSSKPAFPPDTTYSQRTPTRLSSPSPQSPTRSTTGRRKRPPRPSLSPSIPSSLHQARRRLS